MYLSLMIFFGFSYFCRTG